MINNDHSRITVDKQSYGNMVSFKIHFYTFAFCLKEFFFFFDMCWSQASLMLHSGVIIKGNNDYSAQLLGYLHNQVDSQDSY